MSSAHEQWMAAYEETIGVPSHLRWRLRAKLARIDSDYLHEDATPQEKTRACELIREVRQRAKGAA